MGSDMWPPGLTRLLLVAVFLIVSPLSVTTQEPTNDDASSPVDDVRAPRIQRDVNDVTTVLLVPARLGQSAPPIGLLTTTARTFVQDGASTEYATQVLGTTLDNGRLYARILSTSSRVFYEKESLPDPTSPFVVYPSRAPQEEWQLRVDLDNSQIKPAKDLFAENARIGNQETKESGTTVSLTQDSDANQPSERENDVFNKREFHIGDNQRFKPAKVRAAENLPTYTIKQEYVNTGFENNEDETPRNYRPRAPKIFKPQASRSIEPKKPELKPLSTVTYHGFADFTTVVGDTVIVFSPSTSPAPIGRAATTIKGDATLRPDDGIVIQPTSVIPRRDKTKLTTPGRRRDQLLDAINGARPNSANDDTLQPSRPGDVEAESSSTVKTPLLVPVGENGGPKPTGLLKTLDSTTATDGTTTHYKSLIYGTYIGNSYSQIIKTSSNVYFFPDESTATYDTQDTTVDYSSTDADTEDPELIATTVDVPKTTTPKTTTQNRVKSETNEVTIPYRDTTENILTTLKDILANAKNRLRTTTNPPENIEVNTDSDITNDILIGDPQGRSVKTSSSKNRLGNDNDNNKKDKKQQVTFATRLLPSTDYKTFTYFTTFFVPDGDVTTTSVKSRQVVSTQVSYLTELILPTAAGESAQSTTLDKSKVENAESTTSNFVTTTEEPEEDQTTKKDQEIELIFKTLYTTYTYLTTFFQESTSSISSREVVETNIVTQTIGPNGVSEDVEGLFDPDESIMILPTSLSKNVSPTIRLPDIGSDDFESFTTDATTNAVKETTENILTTIQDQETTIDDEKQRPTEPTTLDDEDIALTNLEPSPTPDMATEIPKGQIKTYFTTYTYFTTIFVDDETEIETRTEVFTNVVTEGIQPTAVIPVPVETTSASSPTTKSTDNPAPPPEILAYLEAIQRQKSQEEALLLAKKVQETNNQESWNTQETTINDFTTESLTDADELTTITEKSVTPKTFVDFVPNAQVTPNPPVDGEVLGSMITDVVSSSSSGGGTVLGVVENRIAVPEDQELSESNHHDVESAPTLLLQTSYTTFTYFTTMYKGDATNVVSRLDTVTNVVTETIRPTAVLPAETSTFPVTYFTTFTYWTTFYKDGDTTTTSREETVTNVITPGISPTPSLELGVVMTYRPDVIPTPVDGDASVTNEMKVIADNEVTLPDVPGKPTTEKNGKIAPKQIVVFPENGKNEASTISPEPTTFYTTFTYFTTSYIGNETLLNSRLETITSVALPETNGRQATGRAIGGIVPTFQAINNDEKILQSTRKENIKASPRNTEGPKTGLISTIRTSKVADGTTTHLATDIYGTYIDGLYAQVVESTSSLETAKPALTTTATPVLPTGVLSLNKGSIVDADKVTTIYFTTQQIGTLIDGLYAKVIESTSSTNIDAEKKATVAPVQGHRTGLVRLIQGQIENNDVTTFYESKVIGTSIDGRYAQIIESTSSYATATTPTTNISPTATLSPKTVAATATTEISPSPAVVQSSLSDDAATESDENNEDDSAEHDEEDGEEEEDGENEDGQKSRKKSRLTFSSRKRTFTPVIRPFLSRSRPTFNPKRKGAQAATTITRTDITPTITATLAGKGNRFASSRGRVSSPVGSTTQSAASSRRFNGRGRISSTLSPTSVATFPVGSTRGRGASARIAPSSTFSANRRGPSSNRGSSSRPGPRGSSSTYPSVTSRFRPGIRPSSTLNKVQPTNRHEDQEDEANEFSTTTLTTEESPHTEYDDERETDTTPFQTTTESPRRSTNPLLRFRRPLNLASQRNAVTQRTPATTPFSRRNTVRQTATTNAPSRGSVRAANRPTVPAATRSRQGGQLFPPRGLLNKKPVEPVEELTNKNQDFGGENDENFEDDPVEEIADNDYEGSEDTSTTARYIESRRQGKAANSPVSIRPFGSYRRGTRVKRQASQLRALSSRFRKPTSSNTKAEDRADIDVSASGEEIQKTNAPTKQPSRYNSRGRSLTKPSPSSYPTSAERQSGESLESPVTSRVRTNPRVKPTSSSGSNRQFTLREKESTSRTNYKRPTASRSRTTGKQQETTLRTRPRVRSGSSKSSEVLSNNRRSQSTSRSRSSNSRSSNRRVPSHRGRGSYEDLRETPYIHKENDGTITVTHYIPTEVTIPVVSNGITEHRNIITAGPSTEVLGPEQYSTVPGGNGRPLVVIVTEATGSNAQGQLEVTRFLLHETPTTRVSHTLTSLGGRRVSQSIIVPSTVYSVENVVSTVYPSIPGGNEPLANILLSQLLLSQLNQNPLISGQAQGTPTTRYNTRTTTYVTTLTKHQSTVIPLTFRGKEILTTLVDSTTDVVTATEFITDTVVVTPTATLPTAGLNSLLLLLQKPQQAQQPHPLLDPLFAAAPLLTQSNTLPGETERRNQPADFDYRPNNYESSEEEVSTPKSPRSRSRSNQAHKYNNENKKEEKIPPTESSVVTLYVSGKRPGEFSTVLSTVKIGQEATLSRRRREALKVEASMPPMLHGAPETPTELFISEEPVNAHAPTQSLESVVDESLAKLFETFGQRKNHEFDRQSTDKYDEYGEDYSESENEDPAPGWNPENESLPRKYVRVRVPVARSRTERQHKYTVVRRRPLIPYTKPVEPIIVEPTAPRRVVVTRLRSRGPANYQTLANRGDYRHPPAPDTSSTNRHRVTVTRRRKIQPTRTVETFQRPRVTRKKLVNIRPVVEPTLTFAIITTGFYSAPSFSDEDEDSAEPVEDESQDEDTPRQVEISQSWRKTPSLEGSLNDIDSKREEDFEDDAEEADRFSIQVPEKASSVVKDEPIIITDHFFFPASDNGNDDNDDEENTTEETEEENDENTEEESLNDSISTEKSQFSNPGEENTLEDEEANVDIPETTTGPQSKVEISSETGGFSTEETTTKEAEEKTEGDTAQIPSMTTEINESMDEIESTTSFQESTIKDSTTEKIIEQSTSENPTKFVTINIEKEYEETTPEVTVKPLTITVEKKDTMSDEKLMKKSQEKSTMPEPPIVPPENAFEEKTTETPGIELTTFESTSESPAMNEKEEEDLSVVPLESYEKSWEMSSTDLSDERSAAIRPTATWSPNAGKLKKKTQTTYDFATISSDDVPSVIPLEEDSIFKSFVHPSATTSTRIITTSYASSPSTEDIEAGLSDDLYLSLSNPDFPQISPSKSLDHNESSSHDNALSSTPELRTSVYYTETVVTSTKLRTYTYVVTKLNGLETEVTSSTTVRPRITTLTLTVPVTVTISPTLESSAHDTVVAPVVPVYSPITVAEYEVKKEEEGRRFNLATRIMSNGVEVIVAGPTPALRWENSNPQPTFTLSDTVVMLMPQDDPNEFVTKTCTTTFTYLNTITKDGATIVSTDQQVVANTATEERHRKTGTESASVTLEASPTLRTEVFKTTYTYLTLNTDHPDANNALGSSMKVITNTVTAPQHYLDILEPSEAIQPETNTYLSTRLVEKTFMEDGRTKIETTSDTVTQLIITESAPPPPKPTSVATTLTALDNTDESLTDIAKTYLITYTYLNTYLEKGSTVIRTNVATSTDVVLEKVPAKKTAATPIEATQTPEPIQIFATKTYLTTFTYFTTLLQAGADGETATTISSRSHIVENVVTESIAPSLLDAGYMNALMTTAHHSDSVKNVVTGSTIIFFDEEDQIDPTKTNNALSPSTSSPEIESSDNPAESTPESPPANPAPEVSGTEAQSAAEVIANDADINSTSTSEDVENKRPSTTPGNQSDLQVSNLLSLSSLGINSLTALGPVITAMAGMAGLLQGKSTATRRNDTVPPIEAQEVTTQRSPIYIPVAEFADGDIETAESQNIAAQLASPGLNFIPETRHKVAASLADGIPISPGEVITANSDVIIGKPGKLAPRLPHSKGEEHIGMKPPPIPVPNIPVHPVLEVIRDDDDDDDDDDESDMQAQSSVQSHRNTQIQILSAHQVYEKHLEAPGASSFPTTNNQGSTSQKRPHHIQSGSPPRQAIDKQDQLENDPLLVPPSRPNVEQYANPNINPKDVEWNRERKRKPWSSKDPLTPPLPPIYDEIHQGENSQDSKPWPNRSPAVEKKRPPWAQKDPLQSETTVILESSEIKPRPSEPIVHQVPHVIDRSTGQPLLVNIQPSQVANVIIPQGGTQALIFGDTSEPHISGQYFDDPSPYPEPEVGPGFVGVEKIENNPTDYMLPPAPPLTFKPLPQRSNIRDRHQSIPLSHSQSMPNIGRPQDNSEINTNMRVDKRPSEILLIQRPDSHDPSSGQGHVHTEILVHHRPESVNVRPQAISYPHSHSHAIFPESEPPRRDYSNKQSRPIDQQQPPRRSETVPGPTETSHQYIYLENGPINEPGNDVKLNWKFDRKPSRNPGIRRPQERPSSIGPHPSTSQDYPIYERPGGGGGGGYPSRKPQQQLGSPRPTTYDPGHLSPNVNWHSQLPQESLKKPGTQGGPIQTYVKEPQYEKQPIFGPEIIGPSENVPTGAIGYHNPSNEPKIKPFDQYYPQTVNQRVHSLGEILPHPEDDRETWKKEKETQTERMPDDSISDASEAIKFQKNPKDQGSYETINKQDQLDDFPPSTNVAIEQDSMILASTSHVNSGSIKTVVGKPLDTRYNVNIQNKKKNGTNGEQQSNYEQEIHNSHGTPYGVFHHRTGTKNSQNQYQHDNERPIDQVIQGVPFSQHSATRLGHENKQSTKFQNNRDETIIDLKPPALVPQQFGAGPERPGRPFSRPEANSRPDVGPILRPRPEHDPTRIDSTKNRPAGSNRNPPTNRPISIANESHQGNTQIFKEANYPARYEWALGSQTPVNTRPQVPKRNNDFDDRFGNPDGNNKNQYERRNRTSLNQGNSYLQLDNTEKPIDRNEESKNTVPISGTRIHPAYPHILTKPKPRVPGPITITSNFRRPGDSGNGARPKIQFSLPVEAIGKDKDSKTQTERPPSIQTQYPAGNHENEKNINKKKPNQETLETASQTHFATPDTEIEDSTIHQVKINGEPTVSKKQENNVGGKPRVPALDMMPPPPRKVNNNNGKMYEKDKQLDDGLKPPPRPSDVVGLSPPPIAITTTGRPKDDRFGFSNVDDTGLKPPAKYIPLEESIGGVGAQSSSPLSTKMVPPGSPRPTVERPYLVDLLSQDMVPPPPLIETSRPSIEIATVRPAIAVSGSIQIATAVAASHIPVMQQDVESKIPIIHGTVDLPVVMDVSDMMKPVATEKLGHVSIYTVRPFETRPISSVSVQPTTIITTNLIMPTKVRAQQIGHTETSSRPFASRKGATSTRILSHDVTRKPTKKQEHPVFLEPSGQHIEPSMETEATQSLTSQTNRREGSTLHRTKMPKYPSNDNSAQEVTTIVTRVHSSVTRMTNTRNVPGREKLPKTKDFSTNEFGKNGSTATLEMKPKAVTHYRTLTVTRTETSVVGSPPTTRTLLLTHTLTSTIVETVTETLLRPTNVVVTSTILQSVTRLPNSYENPIDNDSIFVVMSDQNTPAPGAEEVEAEYGEEQVSRDEQDPTENEVNRVLAGGVFGAPVAPMRPPINHCQPECKPSKAEICSNSGTEARCVCRPGFARMFLDRPCKPTYTYTIRVGLERMGREPVFYEAALNDTSSTAFRRLAAPTKEALDRTMMQSDLRDIYRSLDIAGFSPNPTQVEFHVQLTDNANETRLKDVLRKYLIGNNYSLGGTQVFAARDLEMIQARDFDECTSNEGGPHHDCSLHASCFNIRGSYRCSCKEGWADLSENPAYPGRLCSQRPLGCAACNNKGHCTINTNGHDVCECFPWHSGQRCQVNLKVLLIALVTTGAILLGLLAVCLGLACFRHPGRRVKSGDRRAMIPGTAGDTSSEGSVTDLAIPHHVPHILPPPPRTLAPAPPVKRPARKITPNEKRCRSPRKASLATTVPMNEENCDRSLTVMIPRAKYRSTPQSPANYKSAMSTFAADEHKLMSYLESGTRPGNRKLSMTSTKDFIKGYDESGAHMSRNNVATSGALVSAGFQVSATVTRAGDADSTMARSCAETVQIEASTKTTTRSSDLQGDVGSTLARSCGDTSTSTKLLRLDFGDSSGSTMAKSCGETTIQTSTKNPPSRRSDSKDTRDARDSGSEGRMTMERDLGSTLRLTPQHPALYKPDRTSDRDSNFDSL